MTCFYCARDLRPFEYFYVRRCYSVEPSARRRRGCAECREAGRLDPKTEWLVTWPILGAPAR